MTPLKRTVAATAIAGIAITGTLLGGFATAQSPEPDRTTHIQTRGTGAGDAATAATTMAADSTPATVVEKLTGPDAPNNTAGRWDIKATDLGILWDDGHGQVLAAFGDTFGNAWAGPGGGAPANGNWRSNVLARSSDRELSDGMLLQSSPQSPEGVAKQLIPSKKINGDEITTIPTAGISVGRRQYLGFMSVKQWGDPGKWDTNEAGLAYSDDDGETWTVSDTAWQNNDDGTDPFQMQAYARRDGYVYVFGTQNGRNGPASLARVPERRLLDKGAYRYWDGRRWSKSEADATPIVEAPISELSVQYDAYTHRYLMMTLSGPDIVLRTAKSPQGPWSSPQTVAHAADYPGLYGGFLHPWNRNGDIYFTMSSWSPYNVYLMHMQLDRNGKIINPNLVTDPSFERGVAMGDGAWSCTDNCGIDNAPASAFSGDHNAFVRYNTGWRNIYQNIAVAPHRKYRLTGFIRTSTNSDNGYFGARTTSGAVISEAHFVSVGAWTRFTVDFDSGTNETVQVYAGVWTNSGDIWLQADDVAVVRQ
ncbi:DUF4185 domain-containing protein [Microbacterium protaetiae]|uniref:DUF4185 domain-containing protein n=1 Tax=Microbacterium protaetiae TaxID=2509458 RepID=A0A4V0YD43_9MICO|nr:DUF4185 domain-containing protein [Microbacterium protaetiae]QAY59411.1 DUF4185 domain-containing protein [Microbacterium protaetiae]